MENRCIESEYGGCSLNRSLLTAVFAILVRVRDVDVVQLAADRIQNDDIGRIESFIHHGEYEKSDVCGVGRPRARFIWLIVQYEIFAARIE